MENKQYVKRVGVLFGGDSVEHEISILTSIQVIKALEFKYEVIPIYLTKENRFLVGKGFDKLETFRKKDINGYEVLLYKSKKNDLIYLRGIKYLPLRYYKGIDVIVCALHGKGVEDGTIAGFLETLKIPYTSTDVLSSAIIQNKYYTKLVLEKEKIPVLDTLLIREKKINRTNDKSSLYKGKFPVIIKACSLGSSIGINKVNNNEEFAKAIEDIKKYDDMIIVERCLENFKEFNQAIYVSNQKYIVSEIEEVKTADDFLTFSNKYQNTDKKAERIIPANIDTRLEKKIEFYTKKIRNIFSTKGVIRVDYLYDLDNNKLYVNEINSIPGSLAYYLYEDKKIDFTKMLEDIVWETVKEKERNKNRITSFKSNVLSNASIIKK